jgi:hypothetical protein
MVPANGMGRSWHGQVWRQSATQEGCHTLPGASWGAAVSHAALVSCSGEVRVRCSMGIESHSTPLGRCSQASWLLVCSYLHANTLPEAFLLWGWQQEGLWRTPLSPGSHLLLVGYVLACSRAGTQDPDCTTASACWVPGLLNHAYYSWSTTAVGGGPNPSC